MRWKVIIKRDGTALLTSNGVVVAAASAFDVEVLACFCGLVANVNQEVAA